MKSRMLLALVGTLLCLTANAQYTGPSVASMPRNVADILRNPIDDQDVVLRGHITRQIGKEKYMFSDGSGEIRVEIDAKKFPPQPINERTLVEIRGEVEKDFMQAPEIDVDAIFVINPAAPATPATPAAPAAPAR